mgnify:CR=1 FL=1
MSSVTATDIAGISPHHAAAAVADVTSLLETSTRTAAAPSAQSQAGVLSATDSLTQPMPMLNSESLGALFKSDKRLNSKPTSGTFENAL